MNSRFVIAETHPEDIEAVERMRYQSWLDTYPNEEYGMTKQMIKERFADKLSVEGLEISRRRSQDNLDDPDTLSLVAKNEAGDVVGMIVATKGDKTDEIKALYTDKKCHGSGLGGELMARALDWIGRDQEIYLGVASYNERAKAFYRKSGFTEVGEPFIDKIGNMPEQKMVRKPERVEE